jgi:hypothetical protein
LVLLFAGGMETMAFAQTPDVRFLFVGNSYTFGNDLPLLQQQLLPLGVPMWKQVDVQSEAPGGYRWVQHGRDATTPGTPLYRYLQPSTDPAFQWNVVVLQEQSQIPGFSQTSQYWQESLSGLKVLHGLVAKKKAVTLLMMTWGRRTGDTTNQALFPDFKTMQTRLANGYRSFARLAGSPSAPIHIAPVGVAFEAIYDRLVAEGKQPTDQSSLFSRLYESDNSHPSPLGSYLAAVVIYAATTGRDPSLLTWNISPPLSAADQKALLEAAKQAVWSRPFSTDPFPWAYLWSDYTAPTDVTSTAKVISGAAVFPAVRVVSNIGDVDALALGVTHAQKGEGGGRLWIGTRGRLVIKDTLWVGDTGTGQLVVQDGTFTAKTIVLAKDASAKGSLVLEGGELHVETLESGKGSVSLALTGGRLAWNTWKGSLLCAGSTLLPGLSTEQKSALGRASVTGDLTLEKGARIELDVVFADGKPATHDVLTVDGVAKLDGGIRLVSTGMPTEGTTLEVLIAKDIQLGAAFQLVDAKGARHSIQMGKDGHKRLVLSWGKQGNEPTPEPVVQEPKPEPVASEPVLGEPAKENKPEPVPTEPGMEFVSEAGADAGVGGTEEPVSGQGCCQSQPVSPVSWLWLVLVGWVVSRRKRASQSRSCTR